MTTIQVNGKSKTLEGPTTVAQLLEELGVPKETVLVECNRQVLPRDQFAERVIEEGDTLELVRFVGGG
ncbi:MAG: sulfur carrier protein ThiS [Planctomycetota bacterium]|nr:sulfur carrier protein ThiS [Planctomycetota bacterium]